MSDTLKYNDLPTRYVGKERAPKLVFGSFSEAGMDALLALNKKQERRLLR
jgi:hypothetical protein